MVLKNVAQQRLCLMAFLLAYFRTFLINQKTTTLGHEGIARDVSLNFEMRIGNRKYQIKSSDFRIVAPYLHLTLDVWSTNPKTYFFGEPIFIQNLDNLVDNYTIGYPNPQIDLMDSTLLEDDNDLHFNKLEIEFDNTNLFQITNVKSKGTYKGRRKTDY